VVTATLRTDEALQLTKELRPADARAPAGTIGCGEHETKGSARISARLSD
jgi:hypothetical protein